MSEWPQLDDRLLVVFDGHCGLCNRSVRWFLRHDSRDRMRFAPSEMPRISELLVQFGVAVKGAPDGPGSIVVVRGLEHEQPQMLLRSDAVIAMLYELPQPWLFWGGLLQLVPRSLRDWGYGLIARWRYSIWGRFDVCPLPTAEERARFL